MQYPWRPVTPKSSNEAHSHYNIKLYANTPKARQYHMPPRWGCTISLYLIHIFVSILQRNLFCIHVKYVSLNQPLSGSVKEGCGEGITYTPVRPGLMSWIRLGCPHWGCACRQSPASQWIWDHILEVRAASCSSICANLNELPARGKQQRASGGTSSA